MWRSSDSLYKCCMTFGLGSQFVNVVVFSVMVQWGWITLDSRGVGLGIRMRTLNQNLSALFIFHYHIFHFRFHLPSLPKGRYSFFHHSLQCVHVPTSQILSFNHSFLLAKNIKTARPPIMIIICNLISYYSCLVYLCNVGRISIWWFWRLWTEKIGEVSVFFHSTSGGTLVKSE